MFHAHATATAAQSHSHGFPPDARPSTAAAVPPRLSRPPSLAGLAGSSSSSRRTRRSKTCAGSIISSTKKKPQQTRSFHPRQMQNGLSPSKQPHSSSSSPSSASTHDFAALLLQRERELCQLPARIPQGDGVISWSDRDREAVWICQAARRLGLDSDSVAAACAILDRVVCSTRVPPRYLNCVAAACLHISKKLCEDQEETTTHFLHRLHLEYSASELKRMELRILSLLQWDVQLPTISRFLDAMLCPIGASYLVSPLRCHLEAVVCCSTVMSEFRPSVVALSVVSLVLEATRRNWLHACQHLIKMFKVELSDLIRCRERVSHLWDRSVVPSFSVFSLLQSQDDGGHSERDSDDVLMDHESAEAMETARCCAHTCSGTPSCVTPGAMSSASDMASPPALQPTPC